MVSIAASVTTWFRFFGYMLLDGIGFGFCFAYHVDMPWYVEVERMLLTIQG